MRDSIPGNGVFTESCMTEDYSAEFDFLSNKKVLVTGGTGFAGRHLLPILVKSGAVVTCAVRASSDTRGLPEGVTAITVDFATGQGLQEAMSGQDIVIHMASLLFGITGQDYLRTNALMARQLAFAVKRLQEEGKINSGFRFVLVSSQAATGPCAAAPGTPDNAVPFPVSFYGWSKLFAEEILGRELGEAMVTLRPPIIYGSGDRGLLPMFRGVKNGLAFCPGFLRKFSVSAVHADDMVRGVLHLCHPRAHGVYHISDGNVYRMDEFYRVMGEVFNDVLGRQRRTLIFHLPNVVLAASAAISSFYGFAADSVLRLGGGRGLSRPPQWNLDKCREACQDGWVCDGSRLSGELGFVPRITLKEGMTEAVRGYLRDGWL